MTLSVQNLSFRYGPKVALDGVSFDISPGFTALLGPNGAGKSTLFGLLTRLFTAPSGAITIAGHNLATSPRAALAQIGVVFQQPTLDLDLTVRRNLLYFAALQGISGKSATARCDEVLDLVGIADRAPERVRELNGGHRRRMEIARALIHRPKVLLLDEPTVGLDAAARSSIVGHVHDLAAAGLTVLWATHLTDEITQSDHLLILHHAKLLADTPVKDFAADGLLTDRFLAMTSSSVQKYPRGEGVLPGKTPRGADSPPETQAK